jgi:prepilin-type N-terminal cleavage/methylation domain-containing protein
MAMTHTPPTRTTDTRRAFTLVELMVVMLILSALAALAIKVGKHLTEESARKETVSRQNVLMRGIQKHFDIYGEFPASAKNVGEVPGNIVRPEEMTNDIEFLIYARSNQLVEALAKDKQTEIYLRDLPNTVKQGDMNNPGAVIDAYGRFMDYHETGGLGDSPVIISAGPDGYIGGEHAEDDIRSDGRIVK